MRVAIVIVAAAGATALLFVRPAWWLPEAISKHAQAFDEQFLATLWVIGVLFVIAQSLLAWTVFRFRDRGQSASAIDGNDKLELAWTAVTAVIFIGLAISGQGIWAEAHMRPDANALRVEALGKQFAWSFRYPGADGVFGRTNVKEIDDAGGNPFGVASGDAQGRDDVMTPLLRIPAGRPVELLLRSRDVIHNFFVRELRIKQDVVPGMTISLRFTADKPGTYEVPCSELCGLGHHQMRGTLIVMPTGEFDAWLSEEQQRMVAR